MMPLKHVAVESVVGKGVFKIACKDEAMLVCDAGAEWMEAIEAAADKCRKDCASLRKESSRRNPVRRPEILKMRRESLSQIMRNRSEAESSASDSPLKRKKSGDHPFQSPAKLPKMSTPKNWMKRTLSLRSDRFKKAEETQSAGNLFRSPSVFQDENQGQDDDENLQDMYLSGRICPLTPSQRPTDISHLVKRNNGVNKEEEKENEEKSVNNNTSIRETVGNYCNLM